jgi:hypothetical protein
VLCARTMPPSKGRKRTASATRARQQNIVEREVERQAEAHQEAMDTDFQVSDQRGSEEESAVESGEESSEEWGECCEKHAKVECDDEQCSLGYGGWRGWASAGCTDQSDG